jgi:adenylate cyclase
MGCDTVTVVDQRCDDTDVDTTGDGELTATAAARCSCGAQSSSTAKFCSECGARLGRTGAAEFKQVTVVFADVVHSMDIAAAVGAERLREIMASLTNRCAAVVKRFGGTVGSFTGDGIMAVFGAPAALEDHAVRACLAALAIQEEARPLAAEVQIRDHAELKLRVGLNSGEVIAGEIGAGPLGYTTIGEHVGMAQRMESVAPHGGVMLSASTARLVEGRARLGERELVHIKGADEPVPVHRLLGMAAHRHSARRVESNLVGRRRELSAVVSLLDGAVGGRGALVGVAGPPGVGKSRLVRELSSIASKRRAEIFMAFCESHASQFPFHVVARLLRTMFGIEGLDAGAARSRTRDAAPEAEPQDLLLLYDVMGLADPRVAAPPIDPDARRRRLTALVKDVMLRRRTPAVYVIEDAHWMDEASESMMADFLTVIPQTNSLAVVTYRPEYRGGLIQMPGFHTVAVAPLTRAETTTLVSELLGKDASVGVLGQTIAERAAGNPYFAEEIVRDLAERGVLRGQLGEFVSTAADAHISVPATLQATIAARIDRLGMDAKRALCAASVIGSTFNVNLLAALGIEPVIADSVAAQLLDEVVGAHPIEYVFHHPMIRAVAYETQLKSDRADLHRRVAAAVEQQCAGSLDENAAEIAEHLEAAGLLRAAFDYRMRAATWLTNRDISAARASWERARQIADQLPAEDADHMQMRIAPRTLLCATAWRVGGGVDDTGYEQLSELTSAASDKRSLAIGMSGLLMTLAFHARLREASQLASDYVELLESIGDTDLAVGLLHGAIIAKWQAGEMIEAMRIADRVISLAANDPTKGNLVVGSPLAMALAARAAARSSLGLPGWKDDVQTAIAMARQFDTFSRVFTVMFKAITIPNGVFAADKTLQRETAEVLEVAERSGDDFTLTNARMARAYVLISLQGDASRRGFQLAEMVVNMAAAEKLTICAAWTFDIMTAAEMVRSGDLDGAILLTQAVLDNQFASGEMVYRGSATTVLVEALLRRDASGDAELARIAVDRLASVPTDPGFVLHELPLLRLRALLARRSHDDASYREYRDRYREFAHSLGFDGHINWADAMT